MQKKCRMICWPTDVLIGVNTKHLIRQLLHYRARFRPTYSDLEESAFFVDGMSDQCWDIVLARQYLVRLPILGPRLLRDISERSDMYSRCTLPPLATLHPRRRGSGGGETHSTAAAQERGSWVVYSKATCSIYGG